MSSRNQFLLHLFYTILLVIRNCGKSDILKGKQVSLVKRFSNKFFKCFTASIHMQFATAFCLKVFLLLQLFFVLVASCSKKLAVWRRQSELVSEIWSYWVADFLFNRQRSLSLVLHCDKTQWAFENMRKCKICLMRNVYGFVGFGFLSTWVKDVKGLQHDCVAGPLV